MITSGPLALVSCGVFSLAVLAQSVAPTPPPVPAGPPARPALATTAEPGPTADAAAARAGLVVLSVNEAPQLPEGTERIQVVAPWPGGPVPEGLRARLAQSDPGRTAVPLPGPDYRLLHSYVPDQRNPYLSHYVFLDLSDPNAVRNWRRFQRAQRDEDWLAREQWRQKTGFERRRIQLIRANHAAVQEGLAHMQAGDYRGAIIALTRAAELDHSDPTCRLHLAQARLALGHDDEAAAALRRALELQPKLLPMRLSLEQYYPSPVEFATHVDDLARRLEQPSGAAADAFFVLGFMEFQRGRYDAAHAAFRKAARTRPQDEMLRTYLDLTKPAAR